MPCSHTRTLDPNLQVQCWIGPPSRCYSMNVPPSTCRLGGTELLFVPSITEHVREALEVSLLQSLHRRIQVMISGS